ncbi:MAG: archaeal heat shock protein Hsp20 [Methanotrichaceae archaeon]|nr:archaeal heat shock protein Hsp20 [Methanotrichaceae archaeon]
MWGRKRPSIFDIFESFTRGSPFERMGLEEDWFRDTFEDMIRRFEAEIEAMPEEYRGFVTEERTPEGISRRYGPFVYGFSCTAEPGKEPVFREFGNIRPSYRGIAPSVGREPLVDVMDEQDRYRIFVELPGVEKEKIKLDVAEKSVQIMTEDEKKFYKRIELESPVDADSAKASYKNGVLTVELMKKEQTKGKEIKVE